MILTDREILIALREGQVIIDPEPDLAIAVSSTTIDLTLSNTFKEWPSIKGLSIRPGVDGYKYSDIAKLQKAAPPGPYTLLPKAFVLAWTVAKNNHSVYIKASCKGRGKELSRTLGCYSTRDSSGYSLWF